MEEDGGGAGVEDAGGSGFSEFLEGHGLTSGFRGQALVYAVDGEGEAFFKKGDEGVDLLGFEANGAVHVEGVADDQIGDASLGDEAADLFEALDLFRGNGGGQWGGDAEFVTVAQADAFFSVVDTEEAGHRLEVLLPSWKGAHCFDSGFDLFGLLAAADEGGILGFHDDEVLNTNEDEGAVGVVDDEVIFRGLEDSFTLGMITFGIGRQVAGEGWPGAEIVPVKGGLNHGDVIGFLHDRVVDGDFFELWIKGLEGGLEIAAVVQGSADLIKGGSEVWQVAADGLVDGGNAPEEHSGIPEKAAFFEVGGGSGQVGFFDKSFDLEGVLWIGGEGLTALNITVASGRELGTNANGADDGGLGGHGEGPFEAGLKVGVIGDEVICRKHGKDGLGITGLDEESGEANGCGCISANRLSNDVGGGELGEAVLNAGDLFAVGDDEDIGAWND